jgi:serine/threonine-protein kinase
MLPLQLRSLRDFESKPMPGTEGARSPCISADGKWIAYSLGERLMKIAVGGGGPELVGHTQSGAVGLGAWGEGDLIVFDGGRSYGGEGDSLVQLSATGRDAPRLITKVDAARGELLHTLPAILPGNRAVLFTTLLKSGSRIEAIDLKTLERKVLVEGATHSTFVEPGYLLFWRPPVPALIAVRFDPERVEIHGPEVNVLAPVATGADMNAKISVSRNGTLIYGYSREGGAALSVVRVDRSGRVTALCDRRDAWAEPRFSPDGKRILLRQIGNPDCNTWSFDLQRSALTRLTLDEDNHGANWLDAEHFVCTFADAPKAALVRRRADGSGEAERLIDDPRPFYPRSVSGDGKLIALSLDEGNSPDIWMLDLHEKPVLRQVLTSPYRETSPAISRDGRWLAYVSNESGQDEVYLRAYPGPGAKLPVSRHGGASPVWSRDVSELFFMEGTHVMSAAVKSDPEPQVGAPVALFQGNFGNFRPGNFDVAPDGQSFVMLLASESANEEPELRVVLNWIAELEQKLAAAGGAQR